MSKIDVSVEWKERLHFLGKARNHEFSMDAKPDTDDRGPTPKELVLAGICGCTGMDVAAILKSMHQNLEGLTVTAQTNTREKHPQIFEQVTLRFEVKGETLDPAKVIRAVQLSETKYCAVSAMISKSSPISYEIILNGKPIHADVAHFEG